MYRITDTQIDYILNDISARGVEMVSLQQNLLDHVCCIIEQNLEEDGDFESFYKKTIKTFYKDALWEIEEETIQLLTFKNYYTMKKIMIISGILSASIMTLGIFFKFMHWPGTSLLIVLGVLCSSFIFLPLVFTLKAKEKQTIKDKVTLAIATLMGILISLSVLFKVMHWPGANIMGVAFLCLMVVVYIPLYFFTGIRNPDAKVNTIVTSVLMIMGSGLFFTLINTRPYIQDNATIISNNYLQESYVRCSQQTNNIYKLRNNDSIVAYKNISAFAKKCNAACDAIEAMKINLINATEGSSIREINYAELGRLDNYDIPTEILFANSESAQPQLLGLKKEIKEINLLASQTREFNSNELIDLSDKKDLHTGETLSWDRANFYHTPLSFVLRNLTQLQLNIRVLELSSMQ